MAPKVAKDHLHDLLLGDITFQQQGNRFGYRPAIFAQQPFPQQPEMFISPFVLGITGLNPDLILANVKRKGLEIIAFKIETSSTLQIEVSAVLVAGENAMPYCFAR